MPCGISSGQHLSSGINAVVGNYGARAGWFDDGALKFTYHGLMLGSNIAALSGKPEIATNCKDIANVAGVGRDAVCMTRFIVPAHKLLTGQMFWQVDQIEKKGWRRVAVKDGKPITIPKKDLNGNWIANADGIWVNATTSQKSSDGKYIDDPHGDYIRRDWMEIVMDIVILIARFIFPFRLLHNLKAIDLGHHAKRLGGAVMAAWGIVLSIGLVQSIRDFINEYDHQKLKKRIWDMVQGFVDLIALPFDFGLGSSHPATAILGAGLNIASAGLCIAKEAVFYK